MAPSPPAATDGSKTWTPSYLFPEIEDDQNPWNRIHAHLEANEVKAAVCAAFDLPVGDSFTYHASASVNLSQVQAAIHAGRANGLHAWYLERHPILLESAESPVNHEGDIDHSVLGQSTSQTSGYPPPADVYAYISLFDPSKVAANSLRSFGANAKKGSIRATVADYLSSKRHLDSSISVSKLKVIPAKDGRTTVGHQNPALDFWAYSVSALEYAGPNRNTSFVRSSHHLLPVFMHHFGCVAPSYEALQVIKKLAGGKSVIDMGSGNGYWTLMLRRLGQNVVAIDSGQSKWRTVWIPDTVVTDGIQYLRRRSGCPDSLMLLVYPVVGWDFTRKVIESYTGDVICFAGTQNGNGYTGFKDQMIDEYMTIERPGWTKVAQIPLPSFAGKDDALFAFRRTSPASQ
ncbi:hypothetical protein PV10_03680 [Exophiala mesophila]|uniref:Uncharacterized protein n=1 Tax=Exophiala mesophila TaxID=212818 RepID=A0A0D1XVW3_EXOME|nr:uncharacterized protein PV10_03680 [Exophiala mesophila]KIV92376.1 hypothetical protein PV10_03680 [Exophiala mesophila]